MFSASVRLTIEVFVKRRTSVPKTQKRESGKGSFSFILVQPYFYQKSYEKPFLISHFYAQELEKQHQGNLEDESRRTRKQNPKKNPNVDSASGLILN